MSKTKSAAQPENKMDGVCVGSARPDVVFQDKKGRTFVWWHGMNYVIDEDGRWVHGFAITRTAVEITEGKDPLRTPQEIAAENGLKIIHLAKTPARRIGYAA